MTEKDYRPISGWTILLFAALLGAGVAAVGWFLRGHPQGLIGILGLFYLVALVSLAIAVAPMGRAALPALGLRPAGRRWSVFGAMGTLALSVAVSQLGPEPEGMKQVMELAQDPRKLIPSFVAFALMAPLVEELIFRGLLYGWVEKRWGSMVALVVSSLAFAAAHYEPAHILLVLPLGFLFGWLRRRTDSLAPSLVSHIVNNGFAVLSAAFLN
ncbi:MAG: CPBP family intramembrane metalloprotease [Proteobacteria bacterium]|nr:CPBP family intramembrane metalloprotease [Pseudomonadota bacterium]